MPQTQWEQIHINFMTELPEDDWDGKIMMCIDCFSKMVVLVLLYESDAQKAAVSFLVEVMSHCGLPKTIISYRNPRFQGNFWKELMK